MILQSLVSYYDRLAADPEQKIAPPGFSRQKISFEIVLKPDGSLSAIQDAREERDGKQRPRPVIVPGQAYPTGKKIEPRLLWGNSTYLLGLIAKDHDENWAKIRFEAYRDKHLKLEKEIDDKAFSAVCAFLRRWKPEQAEKHKDLAEIATSFGVFRVQGAREFVHDRPKVQEYWLNQLGGTSSDRAAPSLIRGDMQPIARLHEPKIKGVLGAQSSGAAIVSFNLDAFESYGKSQSYNAPVGVDDAFRYCTALDRLTSDSRRRVQIGDSTVVFWAEKPLPEVENAFGPVLGADLAAEDAGTVAQINAFWQHCKEAVTGKAIKDGGVPFYVLGLSPNASRLSVRFWLTGTVQQFAERLGQHAADLEMGYGPSDAPPLTVRRVVLESARAKNGRPDGDSFSPLLAGELLRSVLAGSAYPQSLLLKTIHRIRTEGFAESDKNKTTFRYDWREAMHRRAAILKAFLTRKARLAGQNKEIPVSLDKGNCIPAYRLGRLFAALEQSQIESHKPKTINRTIMDGFVGSASSAPSTVFGRLLKLNRVHMAQLPTTRAEAHARGCFRLRSTYEQLVDEICSGIDPQALPSYLAPDDQGLFFIGYYHQRQDLFTKKSDSDVTTDNKEQNQ